MSAKKHNINEAEINSFLASLGIVMPRNEEELNRILNEESGETSELIHYHIDALKLIEESCSEQKNYNSLKPKSYTKKSNKYFKRLVLAAEITSQLYSEPTFGHVKLQKLLYLCENMAGFEFNERYRKQAAGPYDNKLMHSIDQKFEEQGWFHVIMEDIGKYSKCTYIPGDEFEGHRRYFKNYFRHQINVIQSIIDIFRTAKTKQVELVATLYACWKEQIDNNKSIDELSLHKCFFSWAEEKRIKFSSTEVSNAYKWMLEQGIVPPHC